MRLPLLSLLPVICLAGCSIAPNTPNKIFTSDKPPQEVSACIYPKWLALTPELEKTGSQKHYSLKVSSKVAAGDILEIYKTTTGSELSWYQREPFSLTRNALRKAIHECL